MNSKFRESQPGVGSQRQARSHTSTQGLRELLALLVVIGAPALIYAAILGAPFFRLKEIVVEGNTRRVTPNWIESRAQPFLERSLLRAPHDLIKKSLQSNPWIDEVTLWKELPGRLHVMVREKQPAALVASTDGHFFFAGRDGKLIAAVGDKSQDELGGCVQIYASNPLSAHEEAFRAAIKLHDWLSKSGEKRLAHLSYVEAREDGSLLLTFSNFRFRVLVEQNSAQLRMLRLSKILPEILQRFDNLELVDLRFDHRVILRFSEEKKVPPE